MSGAPRTSILTNPDMLHLGVLPHHDRWGDVLHNLRVVVVDEAHVYRGVFGSHVGNVLRRLRRLALAYGSEPVFVLATATIANAGELASALTGSTFGSITTDTSPRAEREVVLWNPELLDPELGHAREPTRRREQAPGGARRPRPQGDLLHEEPEGGRARPSLRQRPTRRGDRASGSALRTAPGTRRSSDARSSAGSSRASCWA